MLKQSERAAHPTTGDPETIEGRSRLRIVNSHNTPSDRVFSWRELPALFTVLWLAGVFVALSVEVLS